MSLGLDPAGPSFQSYDKLRGVSRSDADIVHFVQTDANRLGTDENLADANFRVNIGKRNQPGCTNVFGIGKCELNLNKQEGCRILMN